MPAEKTTGGGGVGRKSDATIGLWVAAALIGFWAVPMLADAAPVWVNGFLLLVLFGSLLYNRERWMPYARRLEK